MIDAHTHDETPVPGLQKVIIKDFAKKDQITGDLQCIGIHPWSVKHLKNEDILSKFDRYLSKTRPWAIGEIGLDKAIKTSLAAQSLFLYHQIELAKKHDINRIVIHCVKAYNEVFHELKMSNFSDKILLHNFNANEQIAKQFLNYFDCYFSVGAKIFNPKTAISKNLSKLPQDRILLETDDQKDYSIDEIYKEVAWNLGKSLEDLKLQIINNFDKLNN